jgi:hypothetical protein
LRQQTINRPRLAGERHRPAALGFRRALTSSASASIAAITQHRSTTVDACTEWFGKSKIVYFQD